MQFDFLSQGIYTDSLVAPLTFRFGALSYKYDATQDQYDFPGSYTPGSTFTIGLVDNNPTPYVKSETQYTTSVNFSFNSRTELFNVTYEDITANNTAVVRFDDFYEFQPKIHRSSSTQWDYDFTQQSTHENLRKIETFAFIPNCEPYVPSATFNFGWSWYGDPCVDTTVSFDGNLAANTTIPVGSFAGELSPFYIAELNVQLAVPFAVIHAYTPEHHTADLASVIASPVTNISVYTSTLFEGDLVATVQAPSASFEVFTTEEYASLLSSVTPDTTAAFSATTSEEYIGDVVTLTPNPISVIQSYISPARECNLVATTPLPTLDVDATASLPTFIQYLNTEFCIGLDHGTPLSSGVKIISDPIGALGATVCTASELATMVTSELLLPVIEYKWYSHKAIIGREESEAAAISVCASFTGIESFGASTCFKVSKTDVMPGVEVYFAAENITRYIGATTCSTQHDTATNFLGFNVVIVDMLNQYTPSNTFNIDAGIPSRTFTIEATNRYSYEAATYSRFLSNSFCTQRPTTARLEIHVCDAIQEASALPYGRYVPTDPPVEPVDPTPPETGITISVPIKGLYKVINQYSAKLNDGSDVEFQSLSLKCDADSYAWSFTGTLAANQDRSVITPATDGQPIELVLTLNSYQWTLLIEGISTTRSFGSKSVSVSGRGITALLSDPYYSKTSIVQSSLQTNQQIAESLLPFDWTLDWALPTWNVPTGTYSHADITPVVALARHVSNCGGMLVPDRTTQKFYAKKRYPVAPWDFGTVNADIIIPDSAIISLVEEPIGQFGYDGVYVHGTTSDGVVGLVRRAGTAGTRLVATQSNAMMVDATALHTLGQRVLAGEAPQPTVKRVTTFMDGSVVPLVAIGSLLQVVADGKSTKGIVNSVTVSLTLDNDALKVTQQLGIGESTENTFSLLKALVPASPLILGKLISTDGTNSKLDLVNGGTLSARGTGTVGLNYYIMDDVIQSVAPSVTAISDVIV